MLIGEEICWREIEGQRDEEKKTEKMRIEN